MITFLLVSLSILGVVGFIRERTIINLQSIYCILWGSISWAASLKLYGMRNYSEDMYYIVFLGCVGFTIGYLMISLPKANKWNPIDNDKKNLYVLNKKWFNILYYVSITFILIFAVKVIVMLISGYPYYMIRTIFGRTGLEDSLLTNKYEIFIQVFILNAIVPVFNLLLVLHLLKINLLSKKQLIKILILGALYVFVSGSRITVINAMFQLFVIVVMLKVKLPRRYITKMLCVVLLLMALVSIISEGRTNDDAMNYVSKEQTYYQDFTLAIPMGDYYIQMADSKGERAYGAMFTSGIVNLLIRPLGLLGLPRPDFLEVCDKYNSMIDEFIPIYSQGTVNNAYASIFFYFYLDFGTFGVFFFSIVFGLIMKKSYVDSLKFKDLRTILIFATVLITFTKSFVRWEFVNTHYCLSFIYIYLITKKYGTKRISTSTGV